MNLVRRLNAGILVLFIALSAADLTLTWLLIGHSGGAVYESNPVAGWCLDRLGWAGLAGFKVAQVAAVIGLAALIARRRPALGGGVLGVGCLVVAGVVGYSVHLSGVLSSSGDEPTVQDLAALQDAGEHMNQQLAKAAEYRSAVRSLGDRITDGSLSLGEATSQLDRLERSHDAEWLHFLHRSFPGYSDRECLAANLVTHALAEMDAGPEAVAARKGQLAAQFRTAFGREMPTVDLVGVSPPHAAADPATEEVAEE